MVALRLLSQAPQLVVMAFAVLTVTANATEPIVPREVIRLFNGEDLTGLTTWLKDTQRDDPRQGFRISDGLIQPARGGKGYVANDKENGHYQLVVEKKGGQRTDGGKYVRNSGILLHATGPDGGAGGAWPSCNECQLAPRL